MPCPLRHRAGDYPLHAFTRRHRGVLHGPAFVHHPRCRQAAVRLQMRAHDAHADPDDKGMTGSSASTGGPEPLPESAGAEPGNADAVASLLQWYDSFGRSLPWRVRPEDRARGKKPDPYRVWLSEIMLQQTRVAAVIPYYDAFLERWPTVEALAEAPVEAVMERWAGLGYYARARNLHACARQVAKRHGGRFPETEAELRSLPGIGPYTAAAIAAIAFDVPSVPVDGNVERVMARVHGVQKPLPAAKPQLRALAVSLAPNPRPGDFAQALMDLGATVCTPRNPDCPRCPWASRCEANRNGCAADLPRRLPKRARPVRRGVAFLVMREDGAIWMQRRVAEGLLGGMLGLPGTEWTGDGPGERDIRAAAPLAADWHAVEGSVRHVFTHFELRLTLHAAVVDAVPHHVEGHWVAVDDLDREAIPTLMRKAVDHAILRMRQEQIRRQPTRGSTRRTG